MRCYLGKSGVRGQYVHRVGPGRSVRCRRSTGLCTSTTPRTPSSALETAESGAGPGHADEFRLRRSSPPFRGPARFTPACASSQDKTHSFPLPTRIRPSRCGPFVSNRGHLPMPNGLEKATPLSYGRLRETLDEGIVVGLRWSSRPLRLPARQRDCPPHHRGEARVGVRGSGPRGLTSLRRDHRAHSKGIEYVITP